MPEYYVQTKVVSMDDQFCNSEFRNKCNNHNNLRWIARKKKQKNYVKNVYSAAGTKTKIFSFP